MKSLDIEIFEWLPFRSAYQFFTDEVFGASADAIGTPKDRYKSSTLHRTKLVSLLESKKLLNECMETYWPSGWTDKGQSQPDGVRRIFDASSSSKQIEEEEAQEDTEGASFAYEEDLKNYLADNLTIIEPGLTLYKNENENSYILRVWNSSKEAVNASIKSSVKFKSVTKISMDQERELEQLKQKGDSWVLPLRKAEIATMLIRI